MRTQHANKEVRSIMRATSHIEVRKTAKGSVAVGYAIRFAPDATSENLGGFVEQISSGAVNLSRNNVWALFGHDSNRILGSTHSGSLRLTKDQRGVRHEIDLPNTTDGNDLAELLSRGDGGQCSFGFIAHADTWEDRNGLLLRTVTDLELLEISVGVIFPAYTDTTSALRSAPDAIRAKLLKRSADDEQINNDDADDGCRCECGACVDDNCDDCTNDDCGGVEDNCFDCAMQTRRLRVAAVLRHTQLLIA